MKTFVVLGGNMLHRGLYELLSAMGYRVLVVDWNENPAVQGDLHLQEDVKDADRIVTLLKEMGEDVQGAYTSIDLAVPTVNRIHRAYGLCCPSASFDAVLTKQAMAQAWTGAGLFHRHSVLYDVFQKASVEAYNAQHKIIVKPNVAASSRGISVLPPHAGPDALEAALTLAKEKSFDGQALVEEFAEGREFTVELLGDGKGHVSCYAISVKYHSLNTRNANRVAVKLHYNSSAYPDAVFERIADFGKQCYRALGISNAFGHLEVIMRPDGSLTPVEIGVRSSGFIGSHLASYASGRNFFGDYIRVIHGESIEERDYINGSDSAMWFGYDIPAESKAQKASNLLKFLHPAIRSLYSNQSGLRVGQRYESIPDDTGRDEKGYEMIAGLRSVLTIEHVMEAEQRFLNEFLGTDEKKCDK